MLGNGLLVALFLSFLLTVFLSPVLIPFFRKLKFGQSIRSEGPETHHKKTGTPTMGGVIFLAAAAVTAMIIGGQFHTLGLEIWLLLLVTIGFGLLGFLDDYIKVVKKRNLGLTSKQKFLGQVVISVIVYAALTYQGISTAVGIPGTEWSVDLGVFYLPFIIIMLVGASNAVNLTDGLDGLVAGTAACAFTAFAVIAALSGMEASAVFAMAVTGALLGFLVFNAHPAKIFMGDTGSLALGGAIAMLAILTKTEVLLVLIGGVFVVETLSVIIQVASYKLRKRRVFKMSPLHHHFELSGWSEWRVVLTFWSVGIVLAFVGVWLEVGI
ncbi:phospho-N-acetylmuramoyl-pentapeptide-transferase [Alkalicoccus urumqiensis]|uniref:Phospho-N-acetylmuramoyl-pentapeptide-transferase n=1 Tax=Alkalicoccus urumqiensis TaxID=1548213 RepID=A0A2P6MGA7_ALKUR|nr:phospho-N-acetylmuramoyl-pentapeptide-transferase [Alkalicoccus urumqiensis]PRO65316.1 phospho-N-acetylmuramoyl-pentapeptide-transferase [Alkalicoccus urumqiensis]